MKNKDIIIENINNLSKYYIFNDLSEDDYTNLWGELLKVFRKFTENRFINDDVDDEITTNNIQNLLTKHHNRKKNINTVILNEKENDNRIKETYYIRENIPVHIKISRDVSLDNNEINELCNHIKHTCEYWSPEKSILELDNK